MSLIFIVDLDGTVVDSTERIDEITKKYKLCGEGLWTDEHVKEFADSTAIKRDKLIPGAEILPELARQAKAKIVFLTGRSERAREATRTWLRNNLDIFDTVALVMRDDDDLSDPVGCKKDIFLNTVLRMYPKSSFVFFDDDEKLLLEYSQYGIALKAPEIWNVVRFQKSGEINE